MCGRYCIGNGGGLSEEEVWHEGYVQYTFEAAFGRRRNEDGSGLGYEQVEGER